MRKFFCIAFCISLFALFFSCSEKTGNGVIVAGVFKVSDGVKHGYDLYVVVNNSTSKYTLLKTNRLTSDVSMDDVWQSESGNKVLFWDGSAEFNTISKNFLFKNRTYKCSAMPDACATLDGDTLLTIDLDGVRCRVIPDEAVYKIIKKQDSDILEGYDLYIGKRKDADYVLFRVSADDGQPSMYEGCEKSGYGAHYSFWVSAGSNGVFTPSEDKFTYQGNDYDCVIQKGATFSLNEETKDLVVKLSAGSEEKTISVHNGVIYSFEYMNEDEVGYKIVWDSVYDRYALLNAIDTPFICYKNRDYTQFVYASADGSVLFANSDFDSLTTIGADLVFDSKNINCTLNTSSLPAFFGFKDYVDCNLSFLEGVDMVEKYDVAGTVTNLLSLDKVKICPTPAALGDGTDAILENAFVVSHSNDTYTLLRRVESSYYTYNPDCNRIAVNGDGYSEFDSAGTGKTGFGFQYKPSANTLKDDSDPPFELECGDKTDGYIVSHYSSDASIYKPVFINAYGSSLAMRSL